MKNRSPRKKPSPRKKAGSLNFSALVHSISNVHWHLQAQTAKAVNMGLTLRNWLIGCYIAEFELRGEDRARYGDKLFVRLSAKLKAQGVSACEQQRLSGYRLFYRSYPQLRQTLTPRLSRLLPSGMKEVKAIDVESVREGKGTKRIHRSVTGESYLASENDIHRSLTGELITPGGLLVERLSYTHLELIAPLEPPLKRTFYEVECIKGAWSVRELRRQIGSLYFERFGLSRNKKVLSRLASQTAKVQTPALVIRDPFVFDFLGIAGAEALTESELEDALMRHLQAFLLELGRGFCFESRQKRMLIGGEYFFCDLVFYHRILRCHVLVELKAEEFTHEHLGQLNAYVAYYREHEMQPGDQPPVGILLCTHQNQALVRFALAGMDQNLFVSSYKMQLPDAKELEAFLKKELRAWEESRS